MNLMPAPFSRGTRVFDFRLQLLPAYGSRLDPRRQGRRVARGRVTAFAQFTQIVRNRAESQLIFGKIYAHFLQSLLNRLSRCPSSCRCLREVVNLISFLGKDAL